MSFPERLAIREEVHGTANLLACLIAGVLALALAGTHHANLGSAMALLAVFEGWRAKHHFNRARGAEIGVAAERRTEAALAPLEAEGWQVFSNVPWPRNGDIDGVAIPPERGLAFIIETKAGRHTPRHLGRTRRAAEMFSRGRNGAIPTIPVLTSAGAGATRVEDGVIVCATSHLADVLREQHRAYRAAAA